MKDKELKKLREIITESLRVQKSCPNQVGYIDSSNALVDAVAKQNHVIFGRRGCGKTLLLFESTKLINNERGNLIVYINCEDYKNHSFPNVLIEILEVIFDKLDSNIGLFTLIGKKRKAKKIIYDIKKDLDGLRKKADEQSEAIREKLSTEQSAWNLMRGTGFKTLFFISKREFDRFKICYIYKIFYIRYCFISIFLI